MLECKSKSIGVLWILNFMVVVEKEVKIWLNCLKIDQNWAKQCCSNLKFDLVAEKLLNIDI